MLQLVPFIWINYSLGHFHPSPHYFFYFSHSLFPSNPSPQSHLLRHTDSNCLVVFCLPFLFRNNSHLQKENWNRSVHTVLYTTPFPSHPLLPLLPPPEVVSNWEWNGICRPFPFGHFPINRNRFACVLPYWFGTSFFFDCVRCRSPRGQCGESWSSGEQFTGLFVVFFEWN